MDWSTLDTDEMEGNARRVFQFVREHPGSHLRRIRKELGISMGTAQYHLGLLEKAGKVTSDRRGLFLHYFASGMFRDREKQLLEVLSHETAREILLFVIEQRSPTQSDIVGRIGVSAASVSWHVKRMVGSGLLTEVREGKFKRCQLRGDPGPLVALLKAYYPSLWGKWSDRLAEMFLSLSRDEGDQP